MKFVYEWNENQFLHSALYDYQLGGQKDRRQIFLWLVVVALLGVFLIKWLDQGFQVWDVFILLVAGAWFAVRRRLLIRMFKRAFQRSDQQSLQLRFELDESGVEAQVNDKPPQVYSWQDIHQVVRTEKGFLLYPGLLWLPFSGLEKDANPEEVAALLQRKVNRYKDKSGYALNLNS